MASKTHCCTRQNIDSCEVRELFVCACCYFGWGGVFRNCIDVMVVVYVDAKAHGWYIDPNSLKSKSSLQNPHPNDKIKPSRFHVIIAWSMVWHLVYRHFKTIPHEMEIVLSTTYYNTWSEICHFVDSFPISPTTSPHACVYRRPQPLIYVRGHASCVESAPHL